MQLLDGKSCAAEIRSELREIVRLRKLENKKLVFCYSDPGGAKMVLSLAHYLKTKNVPEGVLGSIDRTLPPDSDLTSQMYRTIAGKANAMDKSVGDFAVANQSDISGLSDAPASSLDNATLAAQTKANTLSTATQPTSMQQALDAKMKAAAERIAKMMDRMGLEEGEVIQHSMISKSIERAQKKVEENNFGVRKRLLEYDDVMNKQRTVIYKKRNHALFGERLALDLDNAFYQVIENLSFNHKTNNDFEGLKLALIVQVGLDTKITKEAFAAAKENDLAESLYQEAVAHYEYKKKDMMQNSIPVFKNIRTQEGKHIENVIVPVSDGKTVFNVLVNLDKNLDTKGAALATEFEKSISLSLIDDAWKEHLRAMDDLKQSVQTATYEQKDPLVIYKMEAFELFRRMDLEINHKLVQFLCHAHIPMETSAVKEGRRLKTDLSKLSANRSDEVDGEKTYNDPSEQKQAPVQVGPKIGRNDACPCGSGKKYKACHGKDAA